MKIWNGIINMKTNFNPASRERDRFFYGQAIPGRILGVTRRVRFSRKGDLAISFFLVIIASIFLSGCAITPISFRRHEIYEFQTDKGKLTVHVAGKHRVNAESAKYGSTDTVYGFYDSEKNEIWTTAYIDTIMHELRHFFEGGFHE